MPSNRGAVNNDRNTWAAKISSTTDASGVACSYNVPDESLEYTLKFLSQVAKGNDKPTWDSTWTSTVGKMLKSVNNACLFASDNGSSSTASVNCGYFANTDTTCD